MNNRNIVILTTEAEKQLTDLKEHNWALSDQNLREKFGHVLFPRLDAAIISLSEEDDFSVYESGRNDSLLLDVCDDIATIIFKLIESDDCVIVCIESFIWRFKFNDWFSGLVENLHSEIHSRKIKKINSKIKSETFQENSLQRKLYESIMRDVAKIVKRHLENIRLDD